MLRQDHQLGFATVLLDHTSNRPNTSTAANPDSPWLFPGRQAGQPAGPEAILKDFGEPGFQPCTHAPPRCGNWSCKHRRRSSPTCSATTPAQQPTTPRKPDNPGTATPPATTTGDQSRSRTPNTDYSINGACQ
jgi:hypothetical protein